MPAVAGSKPGSERMGGLPPSSGALLEDRKGHLPSLRGSCNLSEPTVASTAESGHLGDSVSSKAVIQ